MRQGNWANGKLSNAKACALYHEIANVGKTIESSKKRIIWRIKVLEGRDFEIILTHSLASGKKVIRVDGIVKYSGSALSFSDWDHALSLAGGHVIHIIIKPSVDLNDMYDLIVDNISFRRLPNQISASRLRTADTKNPANERPHTYKYSSGAYESFTHSLESSSGPWECPRCTLLNTKPLAPVCEACACIRPSTLQQKRTQSAELAERRPSQPGQSLPPAFTADPLLDPYANGPDPFAQKEVESAFPMPPFQSQDQIATLLSGLEFNTVSKPIQIRPAESPAHDLQSEIPSSIADGDLWKSNMVDLNLNTKSPGTMVPAKQMQTLEQARRSAPAKEKLCVLPLPPSAPQYVNEVPQGMYYPISGQVAAYSMESNNREMYPVPSMPNYGVQNWNYRRGNAHNNPEQIHSSHSGYPANVRGGGDPFATLS